MGTQAILAWTGHLGGEARRSAGLDHDGTPFMWKVGKVC